MCQASPTVLCAGINRHEVQMQESHEKWGEQVTASLIPIKNLKKSLPADSQCAVTFAAARGLFARSAKDRRNMIPAATAITK